MNGEGSPLLLCIIIDSEKTSEESIRGGGGGGERGAKKEEWRFSQLVSSLYQLKHCGKVPHSSVCACRVHYVPYGKYKIPNYDSDP